MNLSLGLTGSPRVGEFDSLFHKTCIGLAVSSQIPSSLCAFFLGGETDRCTLSDCGRSDGCKDPFGSITHGAR